MEIIAVLVLLGAAWYLLPRKLNMAPQTPAPSSVPPQQGQRSTLPPDVPATWSTEDIKTLIGEICTEENYARPQLVRAIVQVESSYNMRAVNQADHAPIDQVDAGDSAGLMGLKVPTARAYVPWIETLEDLFDPFSNIRAGVRFLKDLESKYLSTYGLDGVIQIYNLGETRFRKNGERSPDYLARVKAAIAAGV